MLFQYVKRNLRGTANRRVQGVLALVCFALIFLGCDSPVGQVGFGESERPRYALPLLQTSFTLRDALDGYDFIGTLQDGQGGLRLIRQDSIFNDEVLSAVSLPNLPIPLQDTLNSLSLIDLGYNLPVDTLGFSAGSLFYSYANGESEEVMVTLELLNFATATSDVFSIQFAVGANEIVNGNVSLAGTILSFNAAKEVEINYRARTASGTATESSNFVLFIAGLEESFAVGSLAGYIYDLGSTTINTDFFSAFVPNSASLRDAAVVFEITNTAPLPLALQKVATYAALRDGSRLDFTTPFDDGIDVLFPAVSGDTLRQQVVLDGQNSSFFDAVQQFPDSLVFALEAVANPDSLAQPFRVEAGDGLTGTFQFNVPLAIDFSGFEVEESINFGTLEQVERLQNVELVIVTENLSGLNASVQVYLRDTLQMPTSVDSLFAQPVQLLQSGTLNNLGNATEPGILRTVIELSPEQLMKIEATPAGSVRMILDTPGGADTYAQLNYTDQLALRIGLAFNLLPE